MEPLTTQTFSGDEAQEPATLTGSVTALPGLTDETHAVPFRDFDISEAISSGLAAAGIFTTFPIQALTLPLALAGQDIIGQARTGTGKTLAFGVPLLQLIEEHGQSRTPQALVVVPTRELAIQVADDLRTAAVNMRVRVLTVYGGRAYEPQIDALTSGVDIVVGTPGRLLDLAERRHLDLSAVRALVLDEADKMLDLGFLHHDVERIVRLTPAQRQTMLFSATMPGDVVTLARRHMRQPTNIRAEGHDAPAPVPSTEQHVFRAHQMDKIEVLARVLQARNRGLTIVFCQTKRAADQVVATRAGQPGTSLVAHRARRPGPGPAGAGAARAFPQRQSGRAYRHRGSPARRPRRGRRHPRGELRVPGRRDDLRAPDRPHRPGGPGRRRRHVRRLAGHAPLGAHQRGAEPGHGRAGRDLLHLGAPLYRAGHPARSDQDAPRARCGNGPGSRPRTIEDIGETGKIRTPRRGSAARGSSGSSGRGAGSSGRSGSGGRGGRAEAKKCGGQHRPDGWSGRAAAAPPDQGGPGDRHRH